MHEDLNLTKAQNRIIKRLCQFQLESLYRILHDESHSETDIKLYLIMNECSEESFYETLLDDIDKFEGLLNNPEDLRILDKDDLSKFRHLLANIKEEYREKYPNAIANLWKRLYIIEDHRKIKHLNMLSIN